MVLTRLNADDAIGKVYRAEGSHQEKCSTDQIKYGFPEANVCCERMNNGIGVCCFFTTFPFFFLSYEALIFRRDIA